MYVLLCHVYHCVPKCRQDWSTAMILPYPHIDLALDPASAGPHQVHSFKVPYEYIHAIKVLSNKTVLVKGSYRGYGIRSNKTSVTQYSITGKVLASTQNYCNTTSVYGGMTEVYVDGEQYAAIANE